jgi:hypothetical protein
VAQGGEAPQDLLDPLEVSNQTHSLEGGNLFKVGLDASLGDNVSQQHASRHTEDTFFRVQFHPVGP